MKILQLLINTNSSCGPLVARLVLGLVMFPHGEVDPGIRTSW